VRRGKRGGEYAFGEDQVLGESVKFPRKGEEREEAFFAI